jgi:rhodanese-related sulfurtransferase
LQLQEHRLITQETHMARLLDRDTLAAKLASQNAPRIVEALPEKYYLDWHLPGALHLPLDELESRATRILPDKDAEVVVYCASASCRNSHEAARRLEVLGYSNVAVYAGGKEDWQAAHLPIERVSSGLAA